MTSNAALQKARWLFNAEKAGHTGTLDPLATGLLPLCFGEATKFSSSLFDADKTYLATVKLGIVTDTADAEGRVLETHPVTASETDVRDVMERFIGEIEQVPPMYSALKREGKAFYELARQGIEVERAPRKVCIHALVMTAWHGDSFDLRVDCSKGTYIRTLAADIGAALGCGAHLSALRRTRVGSLDIADAVTLDAIASHQEKKPDLLLQPVDTLVAELPVAQLAEPQALRILQGQPILWAGQASEYRLFGTNGFLGVGEVTTLGLLKPKRLIRSA